MAHIFRRSSVCTWFNSLLLVCSVLSGCVFTPAEFETEEHKLEIAGRIYQLPLEQRRLPALSQPTSWSEVLHLALLANGELEAAYRQWEGALQRVTQAGGFPNSNLAPSFSYLVSPAGMKSWDRTTISVGFDPMLNLSFPTKIIKAARLALKEAQTAGEAFRLAKFGLQAKVLDQYLDLALLDERIRNAGEEVFALQLLAELSSQRVGLGTPERELLRATIESEFSKNDLAILLEERASAQAGLNAILGRNPHEALLLPPELPNPRQASLDAVLALGLESNPELVALFHQHGAREEALDLALLQFIPDINPGFALSGSVSRSLAAMLILPTTVPQIRAAANQAKAELQQVRALSRQAALDKRADFAQELIAFRGSQRQLELFQEKILPAAKQSLELARSAYTVGQVTLSELLESQRTLLEVKNSLAEARIEREKRLIALETLAAVDIEAQSLHPDVSAIDHKSNLAGGNHE